MDQGKVLQLAEGGLMSSACKTLTNINANGFALLLHVAVACSSRVNVVTVVN